VFFIEEPILEPTGAPALHVEQHDSVSVVTPHLPAQLDGRASRASLRSLVDALIARERITDYVLWYYTPMALAFSDHLRPRAVVYDCMDELSAFKGAPARIKAREAALMRRADLVLVGGRSLYEAKCGRHANIHLFPSSVDATHFAQARSASADPADQAPIPHPRLGFFGVIDERMDLPLLDAVAAARPEWHLVLLGPVAKIDPASLPRRPNVHYLGSKPYDQLPGYVAGWDVALLPFARNRATRFISPTKTPEYLAAGKPVVSTSIRDVVRPYGEQGLARIADDAPAFVHACAAAMAEDTAKRWTRADAFLRQTSWDGTWTRISRLVEAAVDRAATDERGDADGATAV
jgi:UDP-galactopyranose mutase